MKEEDTQLQKVGTEKQIIFKERDYFQSENLLVHL